MNEIIRISIDFETMSLENNAAIVQLGACTIGLGEATQVFNVYIDPRSSEAAGLHVDVGTMKWWDEQDEAIRKRVFSGTTPVSDALGFFQVWAAGLCEGNMERLRLYANGWKDHAWLESAYHATHGHNPFHYRSPQDLRTLRDVCKFVGIKAPEFPNEMKHDALADAVAQSQEIAWSLDNLKTIRQLGLAQE